MPKSTFTPAYQVLVDHLVRARKAAGITQQEIADRLGRPQSFVAKYENRERRLDVVEFVVICDIIGAGVEKIIRDVRRVIDAQ